MSRPSEPLSVVHLSTWDNAGGSGRAAYRLHTGLKKLGVRSRMLVGRKITSDPDVRLLGGVFHRLDKWSGALVDRTGLQYLFYPSSLFLNRMKWVREADVIQIFNTHGGYLSHQALPALSSEKPVVWRLSDMWALTGHCSYAYGCDRWKIGCGECPDLEEYPALARDNTHSLFQTKNRIYERSRITVVSPSRWLLDIAKQSPLLGRFDAHWIPNGLDTAIFRPHAKPEAKERFGLDPKKRVLLFSAASVQSGRKGADHLKLALQSIAPALRGTTLFVVGEGAERIQLPASIELKTIGPISDDETLAAIYSAADLFVLPALADNLPNGVLESMACGTPSVAYAVGGVPEAVRHMETGYAAAPADPADLAGGIRLLLEDPVLRERMGKRCREVAEKEYGEDLQTQRFQSLYRQLIKDRQ